MSISFGLSVTIVTCTAIFVYYRQPQVLLFFAGLTITPAYTNILTYRVLKMEKAWVKKYGKDAVFIS